MIVGDLLGGHYLPLTFLSFLLVTPLGYWLHSGVTFGARMSLRGLLRFSSGIAAGFPMSLLAMALFVSGLGLPVVVAAPAATAVLFIWNYVVTHWAILGRLRFR
jgi:putative flippase GtrA